MRFGDITWSAKFPDLTAPDFFLKTRVFENHPYTNKLWK
jgi:hypothetical protein